MKIESTGFISPEILKKTQRTENTPSNTSFKSEMDSYIPSSNRKVYDFVIHENKIVTEEKPDYSNMTDAEIYTSIENDYKAKYGDDFRDWEAMHFNPTREQCDIMLNFNRELRLYLGYELQDVNIRQAAREAAYGDMSDTEIRAEISNKYVRPGMTYREFMHMAYDMKKVGVDNGLYELSRCLSYCPRGTYLSGGFVKRQEQFSAMLDEPLDMMGLVKCANGMKFANNPSFNNSIMEFISNNFDIRIGNNGYLLEDSVWSFIEDK